MNLDGNQLAQVCGATPDNAARALPFLTDAMEHFQIRGLRRVAMFLAQVSFESQRLSRTEENLSYSAVRMVQVWPSRFPTVAAAAPYAHNPQALAENVYGGRMGNVEPGWGWKYRGGGYKMLTGANNYRLATDGLQHVTGEDYFAAPNLVRLPKGAAWTAGWFWASNNLNAVADMGDYERCTRIINGGLTGYEDGDAIGMDDRVEYWAHADTALQAMGVLS